MKKIRLKSELKVRTLQSDAHAVQDQTDMMNCYFINNLNKKEADLINNELQKKLQGYKRQDKLKNKYDDKSFITFSDLVEKIIISKLNCFYCHKKVMIIYKYVRDPIQWTLDRKDNTKGHSKDNTLICCLSCNLQRRNQNMDKFLFTKQLKIVKQP